MKIKETPRQYRARRLALALSRAINSAEEVKLQFEEFRESTNDYEQLVNSAIAKLEKAQSIAVEREDRERSKAKLRVVQ